MYDFQTLGIDPLFLFQAVHSQGKTVSCLNDKRKSLSKNCKKALLHVAELQADDYHLDRPLYYACKADRFNLCPDTAAGDGAIFKCLYRHLGDKRLSAEVCDNHFFFAKKVIIAY